MSTAKCNRCGGVGIGDSFKEASLQINHTAGLSRNKPCGASYNCVVEIDKPVKTVPKKIKVTTPVIEKTSELSSEKKKASKIKTETIPESISESIKE